MFGLFDSEKSARKAFNAGLEALLAGDAAGVDRISKGMADAARVRDLRKRAALLSDFAVACYEAKGSLTDVRRSVLEELQATTAGQTAIALYMDDDTEAVFQDAIAGTHRRQALDDALDSEGGDAATVVSKGWLAIMRSHLQGGDFPAAVEALQGATSAFVSSRGPDSLEAAGALEHGLFLLSQVGAHGAAVDVGRKIIAMLDRGGHDAPELRYRVLSRCGGEAMMARLPEETDAAMREALDVARAHDHRVPMALMNAANGALMNGDADRARVLLDEAWARDDASDEDRAKAADMLGHLLSVREVWDEATEWYERAVELAPEGSDTAMQEQHLAEDDDDDDEDVDAFAAPDANGCVPMMATILDEHAQPQLFFSGSSETALHWAGLAEPGAGMWIRGREEGFRVWCQVLIDDEAAAARALDGEVGALLALFDAARAEEHKLGIPPG
jgi:tetratricopeptide (TPR) repeat protein